MGGVPAALLLAWFGVLVAVTLVRIGLHRFHTRDSSRLAPQRWESLVALGAVAAGALWTFPSAVFLPVSDPLLQMAVVFVVGGTVIGATGVYAPSPAAFYGFCALPFLSVVVHLADERAGAPTVCALRVAVFGAVLVRVYLDIHGRTCHAAHAGRNVEPWLWRAAKGSCATHQIFPEGVAVSIRRPRCLQRAYASSRRVKAAAGCPVSLSGIAQNALAAEVHLPRYPAARNGLKTARAHAQRHGHCSTPTCRRTLDGRACSSAPGRCHVSMFADVTELRRAQDAYGQAVAEGKRPRYAAGRLAFLADASSARQPATVTDLATGPELDGHPRNPVSER